MWVPFLADAGVGRCNTRRANARIAPALPELGMSNSTRHLPHSSETGEYWSLFVALFSNKFGKVGHTVESANTYKKKCVIFPSETKMNFGGIQISADVTPVPMRVLEKAVYRGPHLYGSLPKIRIQLDLGFLEARPSDVLPDFTERLLALLPGLQRHGCCFGTPGGFVRRLK